jgi:hypothetical protein
MPSVGAADRLNAVAPNQATYIAGPQPPRVESCVSNIKDRDSKTVFGDGGRVISEEVALVQLTIDLTGAEAGQLPKLAFSHTLFLATAKHLASRQMPDRLEISKRDYL